MNFNWVEIPEEVGKTKVTINGKLIAFCSIHYDSCPENPLDMDCEGQIYSLSKRHNNFNPEIIEENIKNPDCIALSYFKHGNSLWFVRNQSSEHSIPDMRWDGVSLAGLWIPDNETLKEAEKFPSPEERRDFFVKRATQACELYTQYCNGEVYGYDISVYNLKTDEMNTYDEKSDYRYNTPVFEDSCWGYFGWNFVQESVEEILKVEHE